MISEAKIAEIRQRADIAEIIGEYVTLKRAGVNLKSVCPFHADTDPSFNVNPARQMFHCFGCGASGDVFRFLMRIEGIEFYDALRRLADRYGVELPAPRPMRPEEQSAVERARAAAERRRMILEDATVFFEQRLTEPDGAAARQMLADRRVDPSAAALFRLGYAPDSWTALVEYMAARRVHAEELVDVGLARPRQNQGGVYDAFRHRLMFTITDPGGRVIGFSGRSLATGEDAGAKYINSPETPDFVKGKNLYGLYQARVELSKQSEAIVVEGNFDVVSLAAAGFRNVVAPLGTALTEEQVMVLRRRVERVVVMFDGDGAGRKAAARAFPLLARAGLASYIVPLPDGEDPDSMVRARGPSAMNDALAQKQGLLENLIEQAAASSDGSAQDASRRVESLRPLLEPLKTAVERDMAVQKISQLFRVDSGVVARQLRLGGPVHVAPAASAKTARTGRRESAERELLGLLMDQPTLATVALERGAMALLGDATLKALAMNIAARAEQLDSHVADIVSDADEKLEHKWLVARAMENLFTDREKSLAALEEILATLRCTSYDEKISCLEADIRVAQESGDEQRILELFRNKTELQKIRGELRAPRKQESSLES